MYAIILTPIAQTHYGKKDASSVAVIKALYKDLGMEKVYNSQTMPIMKRHIIQTLNESRMMKISAHVSFMYVSVRSSTTTRMQAMQSLLASSTLLQGPFLRTSS